MKLAITLARQVDGSLSSAKVAEQRKWNNYGKMERYETLSEAKSSEN
jgi:deoxyhypusine synthase